MFGLSLIRTRTLAGIRAAADGLNEELEIAACQVQTNAERIERDQETIARHLRTIREQAERIELIMDEAARQLRHYAEAARDPETGRTFQAAIALEVVQDQLAQVKATGNAELIAELRILDAVLGPDSPFAGRKVPSHA